MTEDRRETAKPFSEAMSSALTAVAPSQGSSTTQTHSSISSVEIERKRHFLQVFRRWEAVFKRADRGDEQSEKWLIAEYFRSLSHLSPEGLEALTDQLKRRCTFFPTIRECLGIINVAPLSGDWGNPFINRRPALYHDERKALAAPRSVGMIADYREGSQ